MMSTVPNDSTAVSTKRSPNPGSVTLPAQATACPPADSIAATVSLAGSASRSLTTTRAPSEASLTAIALPMPRPEPETSATLPLSFAISSVFPFRGSGAPPAGRSAGERGRRCDGSPVQ